MSDVTNVPRSSENRNANLFVNVAILATLAIVLFSPSGGIGSRVAVAYGDWKSQRAVARAWQTLTAAPSRLVSHGSPTKQTIVEFIDYECPSCRRIAEQVSDAVSSKEVEVVVRHLPLTAIHPNAKRLASAAICSEPYGLFEDAHASLLHTAEWGEETDWSVWANSIGIDDVASFERCLLTGSTSARIDEDVHLASLIGVTGTPTFVTETGVFPGEQGFASALLEVTARRTVSRQDTMPRVVDLSVPLFDSGEHPEGAVAVLGSLSHAAFLGDRRVVLLDDQNLLFVDLQTGELWTAGGGGDGPGEFRAPGGGLSWFPDGDRIAVWDPLQQRISVFSDTGELVRNERVDVSPGELETVLAFFNAVGMFSDGGLAITDYPGGVPDSRDVPDGYRQVERIVAISREGVSTIVEVRGDEPRTVLFGARSFVAVTKDRVMVADTETNAIEAYSRAGELLFAMPMPGQRVPVRGQHLETAVDEAQMRNEQRAERRARLIGRAGLAAQRMTDDEIEFRHRDESPPIDAMRVDGEGRLWVRWYVMPGDEMQRWAVWDERDELFRVEMPTGMEFMDARGNLILLRVEDAFDVPRAVVGRVVDQPGA